MIDAQKFGLVRSVGVSNFTAEHLQRVIDETGVVPAINQIERHPYFNNLATVRVNQQHGILTHAWSPFGRDTLNVLGDPLILELADKYGKDPGQIVIRWNSQESVQAIVKSTSALHQQTNLKVLDFELSVEDMERINQLDRGEAGRIEDQDPNEYEEFD